METKIVFIVLLWAIFGMHISQANFTLTKDLSCARDVRPQPLQLEKLAGTWYEIGRAPEEKVLKCLNVTVPSKVDKELVLNLEYIATYDKSNRPVKETVSFPWNNFTQNSVFNLHYNSEKDNGFPTLVYRVIYTDYEFLTVVCGVYRNVPVLKVLSKRQFPDQKELDMIRKQIDNSRYVALFFWTDQTDCNGAHRSAAGLSVSLLLSILVAIFK